MERAVRILWTWAVVKGPATLTATVLCVLPSVALQGTVRTTSLLDEERLLWTCVLRRLSQVCPPKVEASCPPVPGGQATPGCDLTLIQDDYGQIDCQEDDDCPYRYSVFITFHC